ncbi:MAG: tripartite tricarboxylate transporter substrate binding protein [Betaproteobacteria bacterium]|nr:tripartite tricarboxylate transporter substrate binding protein [Betaproteobacteria bacterium]
MDLVTIVINTVINTAIIAAIRRVTSLKECAMNFQLRFPVFLAMLTAAMLGSQPAVAQEAAYPTRSIRLIVPYLPGGSTDIVSRALADAMQRSMGQPVIVDNRPGASTIIGTEMLAKAEPNGYTIGLIGESLTINPHLETKLPYDSLRDFTPIAQLATVPLVWVMNPSVPARTLRELVAHARSNPGKLSFATLGPGSSHAMALQSIKGLSGTDIIDVPYKGIAPAMNDVIGGQISMMLTGVAAGVNFAREGKMVALAVTSSQRLADYPSIPTVAESGYPGFEWTSWFAIGAPARLPAQITARLNAEIVKALSLPQTIERFKVAGSEITTGTPEQLAALIQTRYEKYGAILHGPKPAK